MNVEEYERYWRRNPHRSRGPVSWRSAHHRPPDLHLQALGTESERAGLRLELSVKGGKALETEHGNEYRLLQRLILADGLEPVVIVDAGRGGSLGNAARIARERLERLQRGLH